LRRAPKQGRPPVASYGSPDAFLKDYQAEYKIKTASTWTILPRTDATTQNIDDISPEIYDFRVRAFNGLTVPSEYSTTSRQISGLLAPPTAPQNMSINTIGGLALLRWDPTLDNDVRIGGHPLPSGSEMPFDPSRRAALYRAAAPVTAR
jgi:hypothetical protein